MMFGRHRVAAVTVGPMAKVIARVRDVSRRTMSGRREPPVAAPTIAQSRKSPIGLLVPSSRWRQMPDGPWVLPDEESGVFVRIVAKLERAGQPSCYTVSGPGYDTTEHPSREGAMEAAEVERYRPFIPRMNDWPPMPEIITAWPLQLYVKETTWPYWQGSATEIQRLAKRAEARLQRYFTPFQKLPRDAWYVLPGVLQQQEALDFTYSVITQDWDSEYPTSDGLRDEIEARRARVTEITLKASVTDRSWVKVSLAEHTIKRIFDESPLAVVESPAPMDPTGTVIAPPQLIELKFQAQFPAARLRTIARTAYQCSELHRHMLTHVVAGARPEVWNRLKASRLGVAIGAVIGVIVGFIVGADAGIGVGVVSAYAFGSFGDWLVGWAFPPLELVEAWERSRWQSATTAAWQGLILVLAVAGIILTVLLSQPSGSTSCSCHTTVGATAKR